MTTKRNDYPMIDKILSRPEFQAHPPVLVDIGASGQLHGRWKRIAKYSIGVAFDADERDFGYVADESGQFRKLYTFNHIVTDQETESAPFFLTASPHCSSLLQPRPDWIPEHEFAPRFVVEKIISLKTRSLRTTLDSLDIQQVDWFKTDSQGTDWRLFQNLGADRMGQVLAAEFEPGLASIYEGEDKLHSVLRHMDDLGTHWLAELAPKGSPRITPELMNSFGKQLFLQKLVRFSLKNSAVWGEMTYLNRFANAPTLTLRNLLLGWVFATVLEQHGFALILCQKAEAHFSDPMLAQMAQYSRRRIWGRVCGLYFWPEVTKKINQLVGR